MTTKVEVRNIERESVEFMEIDFLLDGVVQIANVEFAVVGKRQRPTSWTAAAISNGRTAVLIDGPTLGIGAFDVYVKQTGGTESPVLPAVRVNIV